jgi:hypothetical protein
MRPAYRWCLIASLAVLADCRRQPPATPSSPPAPDAAAPVDPIAAEENAVLKKVSTAFECFDKQMGDAQRNDPIYAAYGRSSFTTSSCSTASSANGACWSSRPRRSARRC